MDQDGVNPRLRWFVVHLLLAGATEKEHAHAVEKIREELERREYRNPLVDWWSDPDGPVFQLEALERDAESAALFAQDEMVEVGTVFLPDMDEFSVEILGSEPLEPEEAIWVSTPTLKVSHWPAHAIAVAGGLVFGFFSGMSFIAREPVVGGLFLIAFLACVWLVIAFGRTVMTSQGVTHVALVGKSAIGWDEFKAVVIDSGGNTVVLKGDGKQLVLPHFMFWAGRDKTDAVDAFFDELKRRNIRPQRAFAAFAISRNVRV